MNERIKLLAEQAKKYSLDAMIKIADKEQALKVYSESYDTKFAELIVQECADMAESFHRHQYDMTGNLELHEFIREHFGVEE